jgi:large subunit ribosomal protein L9
MPDGPIREIGEFEITLHLHTDVDIKVSVNIVPEE